MFNKKTIRLICPDLKDTVKVEQCKECPNIDKCTNKSIVDTIE